eukprot:Unigene12577_Nuclearia_a/m.38200 Unigene12577_Nuclearia_a/g.38200  ORF Unigene12577_Nuclearia_a/g.38200 Unigene12577_Nuclearia_a/m.38200 type:complete len:507 (+) Unigene12577_Nuclearia_a:79-1599(+)
MPANGAHVTARHGFDAAAVSRVRARLLAWYDGGERVRREMPWRKPRPAAFERWDEAARRAWLAQRAYEVWVSEIMLQQTQVPTVVAYYNKWMARWPTVQDLAKADPDAVQQAWAGLGYYSRARRLQEGAALVVDKHGGELPADAVTLEKAIPGIGPYTAGAISSIVFNEPAPLVDGNVVRVLSRLRAIGADVKSPAAVALHWRLARALLDPARPGDFNQALMDLGATVCTPATPACAACPLHDDCLALEEQQAHKREAAVRFAASLGAAATAARSDDAAVPSAHSQSGSQLADIELCTLCPPGPTADELRELKASYVTIYPRKEKKKAVRVEAVAVCALFRRAAEVDPPEFCLVRRPATGLLASMWELPCRSADGDALDAAGRGRLVDEALRAAGVDPAAVSRREFVGEASHVFTHLRHAYHVELAEVPGTDAAPGTTTDGRRLRWLTYERLVGEAVPTGMLNILKNLVLPRLAAAAEDPKRGKRAAATPAPAPAPRKLKQTRLVL